MCRQSTEKTGGGRTFNFELLVSPTASLIVIKWHTIPISFFLAVLAASLALFAPFRRRITSPASPISANAPKQSPAAPQPPPRTSRTLSETLFARVSTLIHHHHYLRPTPTLSTPPDCGRRRNALPEQHNHHPDPDLEPNCANRDEEDESPANDQPSNSLPTTSPQTPRQRPAPKLPANDQPPNAPPKNSPQLPVNN